MATAMSAAAARVTCALCAITDTVQVTNLNVDTCAFDVTPPDVLDKAFSDVNIFDHQMPFFIDKLARCCPEPSVQEKVHAMQLNAEIPIMKVVNMVQVWLLEIPRWDGKCMSPECAAGCAG
jgi:hypothetical protein